MDIQKELKNVGLHDSEIEIYLYLLKQGISTPPQIARGTGIARTNCYGLLQKLKEKDLIVEQNKNKRKAYATSDPQSLIRNLDRKKESLEKIVPDLRAMQRLEKNKPSISFYDGWEQVREIFHQTLENKEGVIRGIASTKQLFSLDPKFFNSYKNKLKERGILFQDIVTYASSKKSINEAKEIMKAMYETRIIPKEYEDLPSDILIWDDNISVTTTSEPIFGTVIKNEIIARTFKVVFDLLWKKIEDKDFS